MKKVVTLGGGSGHSQVLRGLGQIDNIEITAVCPSTDSGRSTGDMRRYYEGHGATGDLTKCLLSLATDKAFAAALAHRYSGGPLDNHTVRNIFFTALLQKMSLNDALAAMWRLSRIFPHRVLPVSDESTDLYASLAFGNTVVGEADIYTIAHNPLWHPTVHAINDVYLKPQVEAKEEVRQAIAAADYVVICPGHLYSSIIPTLLPTGMQQALGSSDATFILMTNLMTRKGESDGYNAQDFIHKLEEKIGREVDYILHNNGAIPEDILERYYTTEQKVEFTADVLRHDDRLIEAPLASINDRNEIISNAGVVKAVFTELFSAGNAS